MIDLIVKEIRRLSQDEGLFDHEIAEVLGISRATVNRDRQAHGIPTANLDNRKDKKYTCARCEKEVLIRRKERRVKYCPDCVELVKREVHARKNAKYQNKRLQ